MIKWYDNNRVTGKQTWRYETLAYSTNVIENMICNIVTYRKTLGKSTYISVRGVDGHAVAGIKVCVSDLYHVNGIWHISNMILYDYVYKISFSSFDTVSIIPVKL